MNSGGAALFTVGRRDAFADNQNVLSLNPMFVDFERSDSQGLLDRARAGDAEAFCGLCRTYESRLLRQAVVLCGDATLAEDLSQETLVEAWRCLRRFNGRCRFFTWLCAILLNRYRNSVRRKRPCVFSALPTQKQEEVLGRWNQSVDGAVLPDEVAQRHEQAELVRRCIGGLSAKQQQVIYLRFYVDDSLEGIAAALGCSVGTVKSRLFYALDKLRGMDALASHRQNANSRIEVP